MLHQHLSSRAVCFNSVACLNIGIPIDIDIVGVPFKRRLIGHSINNNANVGAPAGRGGIGCVFVIVIVTRTARKPAVALIVAVGIIYSVYFMGTDSRLS